SAEQFADKVMVTNDNSRSEDPNAIIADILAGLQRPEDALTQVDRQAAIKEVVAQAVAGDMVLLAGKGHETYQEINGARLNYDERAFTRAIAEGEA
ncbi:glutamate ligase domain-containing protein, partial [Shewanella sp. 0m-11]